MFFLSPDKKRHKMTRFNATCVAVALTVGLVALLISMVFGEALLLALGATPVMIEAYTGPPGENTIETWWISWM
jgi:hypothetical protein